MSVQVCDVSMFRFLEWRSVKQLCWPLWCSKRAKTICKLVLSKQDSFKIFSFVLYLKLCTFFAHMNIWSLQGVLKATLSTTGAETEMYFIHLIPSVLLTPPARDISIRAAEANEISSLATRVIRFFTLINFPLGVIISLKSFPIFVSI